MYEIDADEMSDEFFPCWRAALLHLNQQVEGGIHSWLRANPYPPFLEHLSFRLGNQLFFVRVVDIDGRVEGPGNPNGFRIAAEKANGWACVLPMKRTLLGEKWKADNPGWGLLDPESRNSVDPAALISDEKIEMTRWEAHDMAVQIVRDHLDAQGFELISWQGDPELDPAIWFVGETKKPEWVVVRAAIYPAATAQPPANLREIASGCARIGAAGHFASVVLASTEQPFESGDEAPVPLWRGHGMTVRFTGLESVGDHR